MREIVVAFLGWYAVTQVVSAAATPLALTLRNFGALPDRGYASSQRVLGILLVSLLLWLGTSYGLLRNTSGGAWASHCSWLHCSASGLCLLRGRRVHGEEVWTLGAGFGSILRLLPSRRYVVGVELTVSPRVRGLDMGTFDRSTLRSATPNSRWT